MRMPKGADPEPGRLFVMVGLPGAGKTTRARQIEVQRQALRLTPDDWILPLFGEPEPAEKRDVLEGRFVWLALRSLRLGMNVVLDFGVWGRDERMALRSLAASAGAPCELIYLEIEPDEQKRRIERRFRAHPEATFEMSGDDLERSMLLFQTPDQGELDAGEIDPPPPGYADWSAWAAIRWPTSLGDEAAD
jgi:predicted kinase